MKKIAGLISVLFLITGCQSSGDEDHTQNAGTAENEGTEMIENDNENNNANTLKESNDDVKNDTEVYGGTQKNPNYFIESQIFDYENKFYTAFSINRNEDEEQYFSPENRLEMSLLNNDPSEQDILKSYTDLSLEESKLEIKFNEAGNKLSTTTAQSTLFFDLLFGISDFYGVEEITFLNPDEKKDVIVAERSIYESVVVKDERDLTRGYYTIFDEELEETFFLPGGELEEQVVNGNNDPLSFPETVEAMGTTDDEDAFYSSPIVEGIQIVDASITNGVATVQYTMDEDKITETDRTAFEHAIQFAALDFHAWEVELINDTLRESNTYPLIGQ